LWIHVGGSFPWRIVLEAQKMTERLESPQLEDGHGVWRVARESKELDLNSPYSYLLWCRDFSDTSVVARGDDGVRGFVTGYVRPEADDTFFVWQVAVAPSHRGRGLAGRMLQHLGDGLAGRGCAYLEATVTPSNTASTRLFESFAAAREAPVAWQPLFEAEMFPDGHEPEVLVRIGPIPG
jgi:L-2,4-diaminobutyric acid acetyltransferase